MRLLALDFAKLRAMNLRAEGQLAASARSRGSATPGARRGARGRCARRHRRLPARARAPPAAGRDTAVVLVLGDSEAEALAYCHRLATGRRRSALEEGWLVRELCEGIGRTLAQIAVSLDRSKSWVSRRLGFATALPAEIDLRRARWARAASWRDAIASAVGARQRCPCQAARRVARARATDDAPAGDALDRVSRRRRRAACPDRRAAAAAAPGARRLPRAA